MKSLLIAASCIVLSATAVKAQDKCLREFRNKYRGSAEVHTVNIGKFALQLGSLCLSFDSEDADARAIKHALKNVRKVKMYTISNVKGATVSYDDIADLKSNLQRNENFEMLMEVREKGNLIHILNKGKDDELGNVVMLVQDENDFLIVNLQTSLKISDINELIHQFASN
ncbi:protein of unknown function [Chitinophaga ginsengisegetis]|uniref:DUF4252 domain-containing protein n=1 Tax=Chitinophaga ginsengisegetis TaxID=393003 RepID=A0A1T5P7P4_9BACT|nr:DUF4252 domain-containing protein [Chitinophaga ginsengisegetis]MDR6567813.1 uncharacterized protein YqeY [Chitinophaga ginsengisegetis]MDR6647632.1 uncharacterized protein YqeY [Chitinophaga ginsengisegetis]MDR6653982.1 uncharacterized protein YqeY [Chitinophaga ginsengisegetis]SKD08770.1 protein of unknown function [Chitinophaga ginsengisegetis]